MDEHTGTAAFPPLLPQTPVHAACRVLLAVAGSAGEGGYDAGRGSRGMGRTDVEAASAIAAAAGGDAII